MHQTKSMPIEKMNQYLKLQIELIEQRLPINSLWFRYEPCDQIICHKLI